MAPRPTVTLDIDFAKVVTANDIPLDFDTPATHDWVIYVVKVPINSYAEPEVAAIIPRTEGFRIEPRPTN